MLLVTESINLIVVEKQLMSFRRFFLMLPHFQISIGRLSPLLKKKKIFRGSKTVDLKQIRIELSPVDVILLQRIADESFLLRRPVV